MVKIARELAEGVIADYERDYPSAVACFMDDFEEPPPDRRATRTEATGARERAKVIEQLQALLLEAMVAVGEQRETSDDQDHA